MSLEGAVVVPAAFLRDRRIILYSSEIKTIMSGITLILQSQEPLALIFSVWQDKDWRKKAAAKRKLAINGGVPDDVIRITPGVPNTTDEAIEVADIVERIGVKRLIVMDSRPGLPEFIDELRPKLPQTTTVELVKIK